MGPLIYVADAHLTRDDPEVDVFVSFLERVGPSASALGILGDLFNLWFGYRKFGLPHHQRVVRALESLRDRGVRIFYVEGNRDFHLRRAHLGRPFHQVAEDHHVETFRGWRIWATHGDEINLEDRQYRMWKAVSKSAPVYGAFSLLPGSWGMKLGESLERRLSGTNLEHKGEFPLDHCRRYARRVMEQGCQALVLGHFHEERKIPLGEVNGREAAAYVLPAFRVTHRYLIFEGDDPPGFRGFS